MRNIVLVGTQWGDEGKGKLIDVLTERCDYVVRFQGGNNAGHTVRVGSQQFILHQIPSGIIRKQVVCVIGNGVVLDPEALFSEIESLRRRNIKVKGRLKISDQAHLIMPYHKLLDKLAETANGAQRIGTTQRGIGPCYTDKAARLGIRVGDLLADVAVFKKRLRQVLTEKNKQITLIHGHVALSYSKLLKQMFSFRRRLKPYACNTPQFLHDAVKRKKSILLEGAQGTFLDIDHGTYPYVTSSNSSAGGAVTGTGLGPREIDEVIGVAKAYTTRVGEGPLPTEFGPKMMQRIRTRGAEYGATTGRPRRCGWFDAVVTRRAVLVNGLDYIAITKLDVLDDLSEIKICVRYRYRGKTSKQFPSNVEVLNKCVPVYKTVRGWCSPTSHITRFKNLPKRAKDYLHVLEDLLEVPIRIVSVGSKRSQTIIV